MSEIDWLSVSSGPNSPAAGWWDLRLRYIVFFLIDYDNGPIEHLKYAWCHLGTLERFEKSKMASKMAPRECEMVLNQVLLTLCIVKLTKWLLYNSLQSRQNNFCYSKHICTLKIQDGVQNRAYEGGNANKYGSSNKHIYLSDQSGSL